MAPALFRGSTLRSPEGKAAALRNAWEGGHRAMLREVSRALGSRR